VKIECAQILLGYKYRTKLGQSIAKFPGREAWSIENEDGDNPLYNAVRASYPIHVLAYLV